MYFYQEIQSAKIVFFIFKNKKYYFITYNEIILYTKPFHNIKFNNSY